MKKNMYSLMLGEDVIEAVDRLAYEQNTNRSNLINQILANHLNVQTPEMIMKEVFANISSLIENKNFQIQVSPMDHMLKIKSYLEYKYRPTIGYNVELFRIRDKEIGRLTVAFRTQSSELSLELANFFKIWIGMEDEILKKYNIVREAEYNISTKKFRRHFVSQASKNISNDELSHSISEYIKLLDSILKKYLRRELKNYEEIKIEYLNFLQSGIKII